MAVYEISGVRIMVATHYWPGEEITTPLPPDGTSISWNNKNASGGVPLTYFPNQPYEGYDPNRPALQVNGDQTALWSIMGEGKTVEFYLTSMKYGGIMTLWAPGRTAEMLGYPAGWMAQGGSTSQYLTIDPNYFHTTAVIKHFLAEGVTYYIEIGTSRSDDSNYPGTSTPIGADQDFTMTVSYTSTDTDNDHRSDAYDVIIVQDGATYTSVPQLNNGFTNANNNTDDPSSSQYFYTAWWKYVAIEDTDLDIDLTVLPDGANWFGCDAFRQNVSGSLTRVGTIQTNPGSFTVSNVQDGDVIYIQVGSQDFGNSSQPRAQKYQIAVTGAANTDPTTVHSVPRGMKKGTGGLPSDGGSGGGGGGGSFPSRPHTYPTPDPGEITDPDDPYYILPEPVPFDPQNPQYVRWLGRIPLILLSLGRNAGVSNVGARYPDSPF